MIGRLVRLPKRLFDQAAGAVGMYLIDKLAIRQAELLMHAQSASFIALVDRKRQEGTLDPAT